MKRINLPIITDTIFTAFCAFLLFFTAVRHYAKSVYIALVFGVLAAALFAALAFLLISGRQRKKKLVTGDEKNRKAFKVHLALLPRGQACRLVLPIFESGVKAEKYRLCSDDKVYYPLFGFCDVSESDVAPVIKRQTKKTRVIMCCGVTEGARNLGETFGVEFLLADEIFAKLKKLDLLPEKYLYEESVKQTAIKKIKARFNKKLCKPLFFSGAALILFSYFTFFPVYYIVFGGLLLAASAAALLVG